VPLTVGEIREINRYPVKSFAGERLDSCDIESYGMRGDRFVAFYDETRSEWQRYFTARNIPNLMNYQARFVDGEIRVTSPDGRAFGWDEHLLAEIQSQTKTELTMSRFKASHPEAQNSQLLSVDGSSILIFSFD
jgi:uncharacterized protein YcbX